MPPGRDDSATSKRPLQASGVHVTGFFRKADAVSRVVVDGMARRFGWSGQKNGPAMVPGKTLDIGYLSGGGDAKRPQMAWPKFKSNKLAF
jgi:hypothetical protein